MSMTATVTAVPALIAPATAHADLAPLLTRPHCAANRVSFGS